MSTTPIECGIDLGTTNSAIARIVNGRPRVVKNDRQIDTTPSCVYFSGAGEQYVGDEALKLLRRDSCENISGRGYREFKRTMGSDEVYRFSSTGTEMSSEQLSAEVLKTLKSYVPGGCHTAAISVPAAFGQVQIEATQRAAELAGFKYCELIPEPMAASMAFGMDCKVSDLSWLVFDLGGGTFDAALMRMEKGLMKVVDIAGDTKLGGKNIDAMIVDEIILPDIRKNFNIDDVLADKDSREKLLNLLKWYAEDAKIRLSFAEKTFLDIEIPSQDDSGDWIGEHRIEITRSRINHLMGPCLDRIMQITKSMLEKKGAAPSELGSVLLIGGPTYMPCVRERVCQELCNTIDLSVDPMTAVAEGAVLFASTRQVPVKYYQRDSAKVQLKVKYPSTTCDAEVAIKIALDRTAGTASKFKSLYMELSRADAGWKSGRMELGDQTVSLTVPLREKLSNGFMIRLFDDEGADVEAEPSSISVLQGLTVQNPPLPFDICIEATDDDAGDTIKAILRKGAPLPAQARRTFKTKTVLRPGIPADMLFIPVYQGVELTAGLYNDFLGELKITGDMVTQYVPLGSEVEIQIKMDTSQRKTVTAYIECIDEEYEEVLEPLQKKAYDSNELPSFVEQAGERIGELGGKLNGNESLKLLKKQLENLKELKEQGREDRDSRDMAIERAKELHRAIDELEKQCAWELAYVDLDMWRGFVTKKALMFVSDAQRRKWDTAKEKIQKIEAVRDADAAEEATEELRSLFWQVMDGVPDYWVGRFNEYASGFEQYKWKDKRKAQAVIDRGTGLIKKGETAGLRDVVYDLWNYWPFPSSAASRKDILVAID